jgi:hypothetical protein
MTEAPRRSTVQGLFRLAFFRADGIEQFGDTPQAFLASLAPLVAFPLAGALLGILSGGGLDALGGLLSTLVAVLAPPVISHLLARRWGREAPWLRYATAFNWTRWAMLLALTASVPLMAMLSQLGLGQRGAIGLGLLGVAVYGVMLDWFVARVGLGLGWARAAVIVVLVNVGAAALFLGPRLVAGAPSVV